MRHTPITLMASLIALMFPPGAAAQASYEVHAVRYATIPGFPVRGLVAGADSSRRLDIAMMVWVLRAEDKVVLVDAGFYREKFVSRWQPADFLTPSDAVGLLGIRPEDVTDIIITHVHWDHLDGADLFPRARVWIQRQEYEHHMAPDGTVRDRALDPDDALMLARIRDAGRLALVDGDAREILPGITVYTGGRHTFASQYAAVRTPAGTVVIASDNAYLYENLERARPIAQTLDSTANLAAQTRMKHLAGSVRLIVPGHDPDVFARFPRASDRVARIE
jgi:glyoxylase-like metal-dependent hydrolase (beta-lactamase superfamily II)